MSNADDSRSMTGRRAMLAGMAALPFLNERSAEAQRGPASEEYPGLIIRQKEPENLEFPFPSLDSFVTPNERFYIRSHFPVPQVQIGSWRLQVNGAVERPLSLSYEELRRMPEERVMATLECAGNSRVFLVPQTPGAQWELGAVSNAEWSGVRVSTLLDRAGAKAGALEVVFTGADRGEIRTDPHPPGVFNYSRSVALDRARGDVLLATKMNGKDLPVAHGFPLRAVVPGHYGMASVKWLNRLEVVTEPYAGYFQTIDYAYWKRVDGQPVRIPLREMQVKSLLARPAMHEQIKAGSKYRVHGAAWTGDSDISKVEISVDAGQTWAVAKLGAEKQRHVWRLFEWEWQVPAAPGKLTVRCRATDARGNQQPLTHDPDRANYVIHHVLPVDVEIV